MQRTSINEDLRTAILSILAETKVIKDISKTTYLLTNHIGGTPEESPPHQPLQSQEGVAEDHEEYLGDAKKSLSQDKL